MDRQKIWDKLTEINDWLNEHDNDISESNHAAFYCIKEEGAHEWSGRCIGTAADFVIIAYQALLKAYAGLKDMNPDKSFTDFLMECTHTMYEAYKDEENEE